MAPDNSWEPFIFNIMEKRLVGPIKSFWSDEEKAFIELGYKEALKDIKHEIDMCAVKRIEFPILHLLDFIDKKLGEK